MLRAGSDIARRCKVPVLVGASRKSMLGQITGRAVDQRVSASVAAALLAARAGARREEGVEVALLRAWDAGIDDLYFTVKGRAGGWNLTGVYHDFSSETGSVDYGTEIDFSAARKISDNYGILLKAAFYDADQFAYDTTKFWVMLTASY